MATKLRVLCPSSLGQAARAGSGTTPRDLGEYERSSEATENLDGVGYYFER